MTTAGTVTRETRRGEPRPPRRVVLLSESEGLAALLKYLLGGGGTLTRFATMREAADRDGLDNADTVVLDLPREGGDTALAQVRHRYRGELVVLAERGHGRPEAAPEPAWTLLERPFSALSLGTALGLPGLDAAGVPARKADRYPPVAARRLAGQGPVPPAPPAPGPAELKAAARRAPSWAMLAAAAGTGKAGLVERASRLLAAATQSWQARRRVRVAGFSAFALVAFTVAFALASQGRCGPGCDALGTGFSPAPTVAPAESSAPSTTGPKRATTTTTTRAGAPATRPVQVASGGRLATTTTAERRATTTTRKPDPGGGGPAPTQPTTTRPTTTQPPPTTPTTTQPPPTTPTTTMAVTGQ